jgi:hypothetical protein
MKAAALIACALLLAPGVGAAQSSIGPVSNDPVSLHHQLQYRIMAETARELAEIAQRMSQGPSRMRFEYTAGDTTNWTMVCGTGGSGLTTVQALQQVLEG